MGALAFLGSHKVNGVSALHTELMRETVFRDLHQLYPDRIVNKTNGITFRRWLMQCQSGADRPAHRSDRRARAGRRRTRCRSSRSSPTIAAFQRTLRRHQARQQGGARRRWSPTGWASSVDPDALFDVQIKRIHEYKRQLLNILETIALYNAIRAPTRARLGAAREDLRRQGGRRAITAPS